MKSPSAERSKATAQSSGQSAVPTLYALVLVTGVGRAGQIGNAVALAFGKAGAKIVACDLNAVGVAERVREFAAQGVDARPCAGDLTEPDIAALAVEIALKHFGRLDVVVNVAGGLTTYGPISDITVQALDREIAINLKTAVLSCKAAAGDAAGALGPARSMERPRVSSI